MSRPGYFAERRASRLAAGLCAECGAEPIEPQRTKGMACLERAAALSKQRREDARTAGKCIICQRRRTTPKKPTCAPCRKDANQRAKVRGHVESLGLRTRRS